MPVLTFLLRIDACNVSAFISTSISLLPVFPSLMLILPNSSFQNLVLSFKFYLKCELLNGAVPPFSQLRNKSFLFLVPL